MKLKSKLALIVTAALLVPSFALADVWYPTGSPTRLTPVVSTWGLRLPSLTNKACLGTDVSGNLQTGTCAGGSGGSNSWSTTTSQVPAWILNYSNNTTDLVLVGGNSTSTAKFIFDPNAQIGYFSRFLGINQKSPTYNLDVTGNGHLTGLIDADHFVATSTTASSLPYASSTALTVTNLYPTNLSNQTSNGFVKTSGGNGALSIDTNTYLTGNQTITLSGDVTGSGATAISTTLKNTGPGAGSFTNSNITIDAQGRVTAAANGFSYPFPSGATSTLVTFNGGATIANSLTLSGITGSTQCLQVNSSGVVSGVGAVCGSGSGGSAYPFPQNPNGTSSIVYFNNGLVSNASSSYSAQLNITNNTNLDFAGGSGNPTDIKTGTDGTFLFQTGTNQNAKVREGCDQPTCKFAITNNAFNTDLFSVFGGTGNATLSGALTISTTTATGLIVPYASTTALTVSVSFYGAGLSSCSSSSNALTWNAGTFGCNTITGGSGGGSGTWSTTTSSVAGENVNYTNASTDIVTIGGSSTSTAKAYFDPNASTFFMGINGTTTSAQPFALQGNAIFSGDLTSVANVTATGTLKLTALTGTQCLHEVAGVVSGTGSDCGTGSGSGTWPFTTTDTNYGVAVQSTTTPEWFKNGVFASSTSNFVYASTTALTAQSANIARLDNLASAGFVKTNAIGTLSVDTNTYLTTAVTSVGTNNGLTGGTITTTGTIGLDITGLTTNALTTWNGSKLVATGTPNLTAGYFTATTTTASIFPYASTTMITAITASTTNLTVSATTTSAGLNLIGGLATSTPYIYSNVSGFGGGVILEDEGGGACTLITTKAGVVKAAVITCPTEI